MRDSELPPEFVRFSAGAAAVTCIADIEAPVREMLEAGTLYDYARSHPQARRLAGRSVVYALPIPGGAETVVVRRNHHGGLFGRLQGDLFLPPTRASRELRTSERLRSHGVPTPAILAYAVYSVAGGFRRADVLTREISPSVDLSIPLHSAQGAERIAALSATARLIRAMSAMGARHHDLNVKNVLLDCLEGSTPRAWILDVDRVTFERGSASVREQNLARIVRSARKWQSTHGAGVTDAELAEFMARVRHDRD